VQKKASYGKRKISQPTKATVQKIAGSLEVPESDLNEQYQCEGECPKMSTYGQTSG